MHASWSLTDLPLHKETRQPAEKNEGTHDDQGDPD